MILLDNLLICHWL